MDIKTQKLLALAKQFGYTGAEDDPAAMQKHLVDAKAVIKTAKGVVIDPAKFNVIDSPKAAVLDDDITAEPTTKAATLDDDLDTKIASAAERIAKAAGSFRQDRPGSPATEIVSVKSVEEREYEGRIKRGNAFFGSYDQYKNWHDWLRVHFFGSGNAGASFEGKDYAPNIQAARKRLCEYGARTKAYASTPEAAGGALIFDQFIPDIVNNLLQYGVARRLARIFRTNTDVITRPVKSGRHTAYFPEENATLTASTGITYSRVQTVVKTSVIYTQMSMQVLDDSNPSIAEDTAIEIARAQAFTEDTCLFTANGESGYGGMIGAVSRFTNLGITSAAGRIAGGGDWTAHTDAQIAQVMGLLPDYARPGAVFMCTPEFAGSVFMRLARDKGGVTYDQTRDGGYLMTYAGRPVITNNVMNATSSTGTNTIDLLYGDMSRAADFADRLSLNLEVDRSVAFDQYAVAMRGVTRFGINVHDVGTTSAVGPVVYLYQT